MINFKRPMLAAPLMPSNIPHTDENILAAMEKLRYPVLATLKKDGIRAIRYSPDILVSRTLKPIPNKSIRERAMPLPIGFDMELWNPSLAYDEIESIVMSREHERSDEIEFHVLDWMMETTYNNRCTTIHQKLYHHPCFNWQDVKWLYPVYCICADNLFKLFLTTEQQEGEGICFRTPNSPYKQGRSTLKEQYLVKLCRNLTSEATIIGFEEQYENANPTKRNAVGAMDRSSSQHNLYGKNTLGSLLVRDLKTNQEFSIGTGFTDRVRKEIWNNKKDWEHQIITYQYKPHGVKLLPRSPVYKGLRKLIDII